MTEPFLKGRVAIVTGAGRGLGKAMAHGLARAGATVIGAGHIGEDFETFEAAEAKPGKIIPLVADLRKPAACDKLVARAIKAGGIDILVNNAGLTFTYIWPDRYRRDKPHRFYEASDEIIQNVMNTNYMIADQLARRVAPIMEKAGWGRIINVTTKLDTMNRSDSSAYGSSKAALEMGTEIWAKDMAGTGVTVNCVNPGAGAHTQGMAVEASQKSREGKIGRFVEPDEMVPPLMFVVSAAADKVNGFRFDALTWDTSLSPVEAAKKNGIPAGFRMHEAVVVPV